VNEMSLPTITVPKYSLYLPSSGDEIKYRPFLVKEEKLLLIAMESEEDKQIIDATKTVINNCVFGDIDVDTMPLFDIEYIFLWLRAKAKGELIELKYTCPECKNSIDVSFNIEDVKLTKTDNHTNKVELTETLGVVLKYPNMTIQSKLDKFIDESEIERVFKTIQYCIDYIYDAEATYPAKDHTEQELKDFLESLTDSQFQKIAKFFEELPSLKHKIKLECKNKIKGDDKKKEKAKAKVCSYKEDVVLEGLASFFD